MVSLIYFKMHDLYLPILVLDLSQILSKTLVIVIPFLPLKE